MKTNLPSTSTIAGESDAILREWRTRVLNIVLTLASIVAFPALLITIFSLLQGQQFVMAGAVYPAVYLFLLALTLFRRLDVSARGWGFLGLGYLAAVLSFVSGGMLFSGRAYLMALPVLALVLVGVRSGWIAVALSTVIYGLYVALACLGWMTTGGDFPGPSFLNVSITTGSTATLLLVVVMVLLERFHRLQVNTLKAERQAAAELAQINVELEQRVEQRTAELAQASVQLEAAYRREMEIACQIQSSLLPPGSPEVPGLDIASFFKPAQQIGGDFYSYFVFDRDHIGIAVGDVSGKGLQAALMMSLSVGILTSEVRRGLAPAALLEVMNAGLWPHTQRNKINTALCYLSMARLNSVWEMQVANAGAVAPLLIKQGENIACWLDIGGLPLGEVTPADYVEQRQSLAAGDVMILSSDGVVEAMNPAKELYGFERLAARAASTPGGSAQEICEWILADVRQFVGEAEQHDDITLIAVRIAPV